MSTSTPTMTSRTGTWAIDPVHSRIGFSAKHLGINTVQGRFDNFEGAIEIAGELDEISASGVIDAKSVNTRFEMRDDHLRSPAFFDTENHPQIAFHSTGARATGDRRLELTGELTIRGITQPVTLAVEQRGTASDQFGNERIGFHAAGEIRRSDFGIPYDDRVAGVPIVSEVIRLDLDIEAIKQN